MFHSSHDDSISLPAIVRVDGRDDYIVQCMDFPYTLYFKTRRLLNCRLLATNGELSILTRNPALLALNGLV